MAADEPSRTSTADGGDARWLRSMQWLAAALAIVLVAAQLAEIPWRHALRGYDNTFNYLWLRSLAVDGDWSFANDIAIAPTLTADDRGFISNRAHHLTGRALNKYGVGWAVVAAPAYGVADLLVMAGNAMGVWSLERDGWNPVYQILIVLWQAALAVLALGVARAVFRRWFEEPWADAGLLTVWLASSLPFYQFANSSMSHGTVFLGVAVAAWALLRAGDAPHVRWPWALAGAALAIAVVARFQAVIFGVLGIWAWVAHVRGRGWRESIVALWAMAGAAPFIALQMAAWHSVYGEWVIFSYGAEGETFAWLRPNLIPGLFSPQHGLFYWHPLLALSVAGLLAWAWARRGPALPGVVVTAGTIYINAAWWCWWFGAAFGSRAFDGALLATMAGQAFLFQRAGPRARRMLWIACATLAAWNLYVLALFRTATISRNDPVTWFEMLQAAPRLLGQFAFE